MKIKETGSKRNGMEKQKIYFCIRQILLNVNEKGDREIKLKPGI